MKGYSKAPKQELENYKQGKTFYNNEVQKLKDLNGLPIDDDLINPPR